MSAQEDAAHRGMERVGGGKPVRRYAVGLLARIVWEARHGAWHDRLFWTVWPAWAVLRVLTWLPGPQSALKVALFPLVLLSLVGALAGWTASVLSWRRRAASRRCYRRQLDTSERRAATLYEAQVIGALNALVAARRALWEQGAPIRWIEAIDDVREQVVVTYREHADHE